MAKYVMQYRYYGNEHEKNYPEGLTANDLGQDENKSGNVFTGKNIKQIGIQTIPGIKFYINEGKIPVEVGATGVYELSLNNLIDITQLSFDTESLRLINGTAYLIIDILYEGGNN